MCSLFTNNNFQTSSMGDTVGVTLRGLFIQHCLHIQIAQTILQKNTVLFRGTRWVNFKTAKREVAEQPNYF